ncbi:hypothetical protein MWH03_00050 [Klebsiella pneumoniae]|nr:hypothetical protein [Klebsiella pneumoniae]
MFESYKKRLGWLKGKRHLAVITTSRGNVVGYVRKFDDECVTIMPEDNAGTELDVMVSMAAIITLQAAPGGSNV